MDNLRTKLDNERFHSIRFARRHVVSSHEHKREIAVRRTGRAACKQASEIDRLFDQSIKRANLVPRIIASGQTDNTIIEKKKRKEEGGGHSLMSFALRWYGSIASRCSSLMFSSFSTPNASSSCLHFVTDVTAAFVLQYLLTSLANIEYKWDICKRKKKKTQKRKLIQSLFTIPPCASVRLHITQTVIAIDYGNVKKRYKRWKNMGPSAGGRSRRQRKAVCNEHRRTRNAYRNVLGTEKRHKICWELRSLFTFTMFFFLSIVFCLIFFSSYFIRL